MKFADHVLVFMIRGINRKFKQPFSYSYCQGAKKTQFLTLIIKDIVRSVRATSLHVVCDQGAANVGAIKFLTAETQLEYVRQGKEFRNHIFNVDEIPVIPLYDVPHFMKGLRNDLLNKHLHYEVEGTARIAK